MSEHFNDMEHKGDSESSIDTIVTNLRAMCHEPTNQAQAVDLLRELLKQVNVHNHTFAKPKDTRDNMVCDEVSKNVLSVDGKDYTLILSMDVATKSLILKSNPLDLILDVYRK